jgi:hypothetical protein
VPPGRPDLIAAELIRLMTDASALAEARSVARDGLAAFAVGRMTDGYADVYAGALGSPYRPRRPPVRPAARQLPGRNLANCPAAQDLGEPARLPAPVRLAVERDR